MLKLKVQYDYYAVLAVLLYISCVGELFYCFGQVLHFRTHGNCLFTQRLKLRLITNEILTVLFHRLCCHLYKGHLLYFCYPKVRGVIHRRRNMNSVVASFMLPRVQGTSTLFLLPFARPSK